jgi:3-deoxy-D-manno-octulosonic-acid transferase
MMAVDLPKPRHPVSMWLHYGALQLLMHVLLPFGLILLAYRGIREPAHLRGIAERFGFGPIGPKGAVWVYAASLGETRAASALIKRLRAEGHAVLLCHLSPAGLAEGWRLFPHDPGITHRYMPVDLFWAVRFFLRRANPVLGIVLEIEIWPAMLLEARRAAVPMVLANGNLLENSMSRQKGLRKHLMRLYAEFAHIFTRDAGYRDRYLRAGVAPARISVVGELKYDQWIEPQHPLWGGALRDRWGAKRILMIASSVKDEEPALIAMVQALLGVDPGLGVLWVPRSPQRFGPLGELVDAGFAPVYRSMLGPRMEGQFAPDARVVLGDSIGEMNAYYAMADLVFVGASLVDHGGHNIMEPMAMGKPVVMGPSIFGIAFAAIPAAEAGAFESLPDAAALQMRIMELFSNPAALQEMAQRATDFAADKTGAADRTIKGLKSFLPPPGPSSDR